MNYPKESILILCNLLNRLFEGEILSELFKNAEKDFSGSVVLNLWRLIHKFSCPTKMNCKTENVIQCVKFYLAQLGYMRMYFYALPSDMSHGSQELLFAFTWVISKQEIEKSVDRFLKDKRQTSEYFPLCNYNIQVEQNGGKQDTRSTIFKSKFNLRTKKTEKTVSELKPVDYFNYMLLKAGKLKQLLVINKELMFRRNELVNKLHSETSDSFGLFHLSVGESVAISQPNYMEIYFNEMKDTIELMDAYISWFHSSKAFFVWMDGLMGEKLKKETTLPTDAQLTRMKEFQLLLENLCEDEVNEIPILTSLSNLSLSPNISGKTFQEYEEQFDELIKGMFSSLDAFTVE